MGTDDSGKDRTLALDVHRPLGLGAIALAVAIGCDGVPTRLSDAEIVTELVGPAGGEVRLGDRVAIAFPPGALRVETRITIREIDPPAFLVAAGGRGPAYRVDPDGLVLDAPATIRFLVPTAVVDDPEGLGLVTSAHPLSMGPAAFWFLAIEDRRPTSGGIVLVARTVHLGPLQAAPIPPS